MQTTVICKFCDRRCGNNAGLAAHVRAMHPEEWEREIAEAEARSNGEAPPAPPTSNGLVWEDPPARSKKQGAIDAIVALIPELRRNPNKWARLYTWRNKTSAATIATTLRKMEDLADIEFRSSVADGTGALHGRYTGE